MKWAALVPELAVSHLDQSKAFYCDVLSFHIDYEREGFAYLSLGNVQLMMEQAGPHWSTGPLEHPFGRGINFQIQVNDVGLLYDNVQAAHWPIFLPLKVKWFLAGQIERGQKEFIVQDGDGYLLRFCQAIGERVAG